MEATKECVVLEKIIRIKNVGKFKDCTARGDVAFRKLNLVYAENGRGKTTFCDILRSLQSGIGELIAGRGTLGITDDPTVELRCGQNITFKNDAWNTVVPDIAVFDDSYVYENVHAGEFVQHDQKRGLYGVIIGATGVALQRKVDALDAQSRDAAKDLKNAQAALKGHLPTGLVEAAFLALEPDDEIDEKITTQRGAVKAIENAAAIKTRAALLPIALPEFPGEVLAILSATLESLEADTEERVHKQLHDHTEGATQAWIADGLGFQKDDTCPFCGQDTSDVVDLLSAYQVCFGEFYEQLRAQVATLRAEVEQAGSQANTQAIQHHLVRNTHSLDFWQQFVDITPPTLPFDDVSKALTEYTATATTLLDKKAAALFHQVEEHAKRTTMQRCVTEVTAAITAYNAAVKDVNREIERVKAATQAADATKVEKELAHLEAVKLRVDPTVAAACQTVLDAKTEKARIDTAKKMSKTALDQHGNTVLPQFQGLINTLLNNFGVGFRIQNVERSFAGGKASTSYQLLINHVPVELGDPTTSKGEPSFRNTLSAGDRRTLALAFFIAQLKLDPALKEKLVVFDDPFTSQDSSRRRCTQQQICRLANTAKQVIVLSHEASFLKIVHEAYPNSGDIKTLQLARVGSDETVVAKWDIEDTALSSWDQDVRTLQEFVNESQGNPRDVVRAIRPMLEGYLRSTCIGSFSDGEWLGDFICKIRNADEDDPASNFQPILNEIEDINDYSKRFHHNNNSAADNEPLDDNELRAYAQRTLNLVGAPPRT